MKCLRCGTAYVRMTITGCVRCIECDTLHVAAWDGTWRIVSELCRVLVAGAPLTTDVAVADGGDMNDDETEWRRGRELVETIQQMVESVYRVSGCHPVELVVPDAESLDPVWTFLGVPKPDRDAVAHSHLCGLAVRVDVGCPAGMFYVLPMPPLPVLPPVD